MSQKSARYPFFVACCLFILLLAGCGSQGASKSVASVPLPLPVDGTPRASYSQQIFRISLGGEIISLDPAIEDDFSSDEATRLLFVGLVQMDNDLQIQPCLASSWSTSTDGLQWTFHLQPHLTFSDGTPLTSQDVAYSIDRALQPAIKSSAYFRLSLIQDSDLLHTGRIKTIIGDSILTPDATTIIFKLNRRGAYFLYTLTHPSSYVVEKKLIDKYGDQKFTDHLSEGGGAGPFKFQQHIQGKEIDFVPNPYYYGLKPLLQKVELLTNNSADTFQDYQHGLVDMSYARDDYVDTARQHNEYYQTSLLQVDYVAMNFLAKPFDNLRIRQAFALAINRDNLVSSITVGTYHILLQGVIGYNLNLTGPMGVKDSRGNVSLASQLFQQGLSEEGWSSVSQLPTIKFSYGAGNDSEASAIAKMWQDVLGVKVVFDAPDYATFLNRVNATVHNANGLQLWLDGWAADDPDPHNLMFNFEQDAPYNAMNYGQNNSADALQEQTIQQLLTRADVEQNPSLRIQLYQSAEQQIINQVGWIPLLQWTQKSVIKPYVKGIKLNPLDVFPPGAWSTIYIAAH